MKGNVQGAHHFLIQSVNQRLIRFLQLSISAVHLPLTRKCVQQWHKASSWSPVMCTWTMLLARALNILKGQQTYFHQILNSSAISELMWSLNNSDSCVTQVQRLNSMLRDFSLSWHWAGLEGPFFSFPSGKLIKTKPFSLSRLWERVKFVFKTTHLVRPWGPHRIIVLYGAVTFSVGPPLFPRVSKLVTMVRFLSVRIRFVLSGSWWCENWYLVMYVWPPDSLRS